MALTGKTRVRMTRWTQKLILQVQTSWPPTVRVTYYEYGTSEERDDLAYSWRDATLADLQKLGEINPAPTQIPAKLTVVK